MRSTACAALVISTLLAAACTGSHPPPSDAGVDDAGRATPDTGAAVPPDSGADPEPLPDAGAAPTLALEDFCAAISEAVSAASRGEECLCESARADAIGQQMRQECEEHPFHDWVRDGEARFDEEAAAELLAEEGHVASCYTFRPASFDLRVVTGTVPDGTPCEPSYEWPFLQRCAAGSFCRSVGSDEYVCTRRREEGEPCAEEDLCWTAQGYCDERTRRCRAFAREGESCADRECVRGLSCRDAVCEPPYEDPPLRAGAFCELGYGAPCEGDLRCIAGRCAMGGVGGDACGGPSDCRSGACVDGECVDPGGPLEACAPVEARDCHGHHAAGACNGVCAPGPGFTNQCLYLCERGSCIEGVCRLSVVAGGACDADLDCSSSYCVDGVCRAAICNPEWPLD